MSLAMFVTLSVPFVMLPVWAAETVAFRPPERRRLGWRLAVASIAAALGLAAARWAAPPDLLALSMIAGGSLVLFACNVALVVWVYAARPSQPRGFPVQLMSHANRPSPPIEVSVRHDQQEQR